MSDDDHSAFQKAYAMLSPEDQAQADTDRSTFGKCVIEVRDGKAVLHPPWHYITGLEIVERRKQ